MKKILLSLAIILSSAIAYCGCPAITAIIFHSGATKNDYTLAIYLTKNLETFHIQDFIYCDGAQMASGCNTFKENGTIYIEFNCTGKPTAMVNVYTQSCGNNSNLCTSVPAVPPGVSSLPIVISGFFVQRNKTSVITNWQTQQETNSDRFEVERSFDNQFFQTVGTVKSHENSSVINNYSFTTITDTKNTSFFRVKLIDKDGSVSYTPIKPIKGLAVKAGYTLFPNPAFSHSKVTITDLNEPATVQMLDNSGRLIKVFPLVKSNTVDIGNLQNGTYIIRIIGTISNETTVRRLTVIDK